MNGEAADRNHRPHVLADAAEIRRALSLIVEPGSVVELRAKRGRFIVAGYYDDMEKLTRDAARLSGSGVEACWVTLNPAHRALLARANNRTIDGAQKLTTDGDILRRRWIPVDADSERPAGISATDSEHEAALRVAGDLYDYLREELGGDFIFMDSGNGAQIWIPVDLPNDDITTQLVKRFLAALDFMFSDERVKIDVSTCNAARVSKLPGTLAAKGDSMIDRPHRLAYMPTPPDSPLPPIPRNKIEAVAERAPKAAETKTSSSSNGKAGFDLEKFLKEQGIAITKSAPFSGGTKYIFDCRWNPEHINKAWAAVFPSGATAAGCLAASCRSHGWHDFPGKEKLRRPSAKPEPEPEQSESALPTIDVSVVDLPKVAKQAWNALSASNQPPRMFLHGGPVRLEIDQKDGGPTLRSLTEDRLRHELARSANWIQKKTKKVTVAVPPPMLIARDLLATPNPKLPLLGRIVEIPVFTDRYELIRAPGYHKDSRIYYHPAAGLVVPPIPIEPTDDELKAARDLWFDDLFFDFSFAGDADKAHAIALPLQCVVREMIDGCTPLHVIESPGPGHGKGLLLDVVVRAVYGHVGLLSESRDDDEWRKRITSALVMGRAIILIDNVTRPLISGSLSSAITNRDLWEDRLMKTNDLVNLQIRNAWALTGNNVELSEELSRRAVPTRIDAKIDRPWERDPATFKHPELLVWASENRGNLIAALLTMAQAWIARGRRKPKSPSLGSFESWARVIGGILETAGISGFLDNSALSNLYDRTDRDGAVWRAFIELWWERFGDRALTARELFPLATELDLNLGKAEDEHARKVAFGKRLGSHRDRVLGDFLIAQAGKEHKTVLWKLVRVREAAS